MRRPRDHRPRSPGHGGGGDGAGPDAAPGTGWTRHLAGRPRRAGVPTPGDPRSQRRRRSADGRRHDGRRARLQRRDLQRPRTARSPRRPRPLLPQRLRYGGPPAGLPGVGVRVRRPLQRHVGLRDLGSENRHGLLLAGQAWRQAVLLRPPGGPPRDRLRAQGVALALPGAPPGRRAHALPVPGRSPFLPRRPQLLRRYPDARTWAGGHLRTRPIGASPRSLLGLSERE